MNLNIKKIAISLAFVATSVGVGAGIAVPMMISHHNKINSFTQKRNYILKDSAMYGVIEDEKYDAAAIDAINNVKKNLTLAKDKVSVIEYKVANFKFTSNGKVVGLVDIDLENNKVLKIEVKDGDKITKYQLIKKTDVYTKNGKEDLAITKLLKNSNSKILSKKNYFLKLVISKKAYVEFDNLVKTYDKQLEDPSSIIDKSSQSNKADFLEAKKAYDKSYAEYQKARDRTGVPKEQMGLYLQKFKKIFETTKLNLADIKFYNK